jgi:Zn-dependent protease
MDQNLIINGLLQYLSLVILLTFHEYGHAWMAMQCGDDTAKSEGRCSLNPLVHMDPIGTGLIPLLQIFSPAFGSFLLGWAKPVPVNLNNLRHPKRDDILVSMAGPAMNVLLAIGLVALARVAGVAGQGSAVGIFISMAHLSLLLCFFNLLPIPPLDGSHVMRVLIGMDYLTYLQIAQYGFILIILILNFVPYVGALIGMVSAGSLVLLARLFGLG